MDYERVAKLLPDGVGDTWSFKINQDGSFSFNAHSPAGEDLWVEGLCKSPETALDDIKERVVNERDCFNVDEHVSLYSSTRGERGVPGTFDELLEDAKAVGEMLEELALMVGEWVLPVETDRLDCPICAYPLADIDESLFETIELEEGRSELVYRCPQCFFVGFKEGINLFWGYPEQMRLEQRASMYEQYRLYIDSLYAERMKNAE